MIGDPSHGAVLAYVRWAVKRSELTSTQRAVAIEVATHYNRDDGHARPSHPEIADVLGLHEKTVYRAVRAVTAAGIWATDTREGCVTRYRFPLASAVATPRASAGGDNPQPPAPAREGDNPQPPAPASRPPAPASPTPRAGAGRTLLEQELEQEAPRTDADDVDAADVPADRFSFDAGEAWRRAKAARGIG
jgi:hypothetical protein